MKSFHIWDFPDDIYILLTDKTKEKLFAHLYSKLCNRERLAKFLNLDPTTVEGYQLGFTEKDGRTWAQYIPIKFLKLTKRYFNNKLMSRIEKSVLAYRPRAGTSIENPSLPIKESPALYRIIGHILGDGSATKKKVPYYSNSCKELRNEFIRDLQVFGKVKISNVKLGTYAITFPKAITKILSYCFEVPLADKQGLPKNIFSASKICRAAILRALFDDEGSCSSQITIGMISKNIIGGIRRLLLEFGIMSGGIYTSKNKSGSNHYTIRISAKSNEDFMTNIGFSHPIKQQRLAALVNRKHRLKRTRTTYEIEKLIMVYLKSASYARTMDIADNILLSLNHTLFHLKRMESAGKIKKVIEENKYFCWKI